ncbi:MAG TPA: zinc-dependent metalloprotease [Actinomycetes bacterium]|nr:zinc-dependent metalloprotease [Actinomycetes bacterium]
MSDFPFGFRPPGDDEPGGPGEGGPLPFGFSSSADLGEMLQQLGRALSSGDGGPVNWNLARDTARQVVAAEGDRSVAEAEQRAAEESARLAEVWLDPTTTLPAGTTSARAWSRSEWIEGTLPTWARIVGPVAEKVSAASAEALPEEMRSMAGPMLGMLRQLGGAMFGGQVGQGLGHLALEVLSGTDIGLPLAPAGVAVLLPANITAFGAGLSVPQDDVRLYVALREAAHHRLYGHVAWLEARLLGAIEEYAAGINVDASRLQELFGGIDPGDPAAIQRALESGVFEPEDTPAQQAALARLETLLALVEGWVDTVVTRAAGPIAAAGAIQEAIRRRRASGGPAEQTFATLVGLELRPRRLREAARLWAALEDAKGVGGRDAVWAHPDLLPGPADLDDPEAFARATETDWDIAALDDGPGDGPEGTAQPDPQS